MLTTTVMAYSQRPLFACCENSMPSDPMRAERSWAIQSLNEWFSIIATEKILSLTADHNILRWETVYQLCISSSKEEVLRLLRLGLLYSVPWHQNNLFHAAARRQDTDPEIIDHLLANLPQDQYFLAFQPDDTGLTPLQIVLSQPHFGAKEARLLMWALELMRHWWDMMDYNRMLTIAARNGNIGAVKFLLDNLRYGQCGMNIDPLFGAFQYMTEQIGNAAQCENGCDILRLLALYPSTRSGLGRESGIRH